MNSGMKVGLGRPENSNAVLCVSPQYIQNKRNIYKNKKKHQLDQSVTSENLFRSGWNRSEQGGTGLFSSVLGMFRFSTFPMNRCSPSATGPVENLKKNPFRNVPPAPEHFQSAGSPGIRGAQRFARGAVPDVPDVSRACAGFWFSAPICGPARCPPWPS